MSILQNADGTPEDGLPVWRLNQVLTLIQGRIEKLSIEKKVDTPIVWGSAHMYGTIQLGKLVALKRGLDPELAGLVCAFHDIFTLHTDDNRNHGENAEPFIREIIAEYNEKWGAEFSEITDNEVSLVFEAIRRHSDKKTITDDPYGELLKDVDCLDAFMHGFEPPEENGRLQRVNGLLAELGLNHRV
jgi:uncharacterized protein